MENQSVWSKSFTTKEQFTIVKRLMVYAKPFRRTFLVAIIFAIGVSLMNVLLPKIIQVYMDDFLSAQSATAQVIAFFAMLYLIGVVIKSVVWFFQWYLYSVASMRSFQLVRSTLYQKLHTLGMRYFDQTPAGSIVSRVSNDTETLWDFWFVFLTIITGIFAVISSLLAMLSISLKSTLVCAAFLPLLLLIIWYYQKYSSRIYRRMREKLSQLNTKLNESISGMQIVQQFRQEKRFVKEFDEINQSYLANRYEVIRTNSLLLSPIISLLYALAVAAVLSLFGFDALSAPVEAGLIYAFLTYVQALFNPMTTMMDFLSVFTDGLVAGSRILKILDEEEEAPSQNQGANGKILNGKVEFRHVSFSYDGQKKILDDISFVVHPGETIALVGHTGSGKSSIINVLMRFYEFYDGQIFIDDRDIRDYPMSELRQKMGLVLQDAFMFYGDIAGNIRLMNENITDEEVKRAARFVQADKFIEKLDGKYHSKVIEGGVSYSAGERQLLSFARTMVTNPKILVLDEATASIDTETEAFIQAGLANMRQGRTTIAIAHRLSTIRDANQILVLDQGKIVERGDHQTLIHAEGLYYEMYRLQKGGFDTADEDES